MIGSSNKLLLLAFLLGAGPAAWAAPDKEPHPTAPLLNQEEMEGSEGASSDTPGDSVTEPQDTIRETTVSAPPVDGFGTLEQGKGALPADIWKGLSRASADPLLALMRSGVANATLKDLVTRLLMTQGPPPEGNAAQSWFTLRVNALVTIGEDEKAQQMMESIPSSMRLPSLAALEAGLELVRGEYDHACRRAQPDAPAADDSGEDFWRKLGILCQAHAGKQDEATVGIDLMREERHTDDVFFQEAIRRIGDRQAVIKSNPKEWTLLNVALLRRSGDFEKLKSNMDAFPPVAVKYLAQDASLDIKLRDKAAGRAEQLGVLPESPGSIPPEQPFSRTLASDVTTLVRALGSDEPVNDADNGVIARLALGDAGIGDSRRIQRLLTLMEPFGYRVPPEVWAKLFIHRERVDGDVPPASLVARLGEAAAAGRRGEVVLLSGLIAGGSEVDRLPSLALLPVIKALIAAGFEKEARAVAHDAVKRYSAR